MADRTRVSERFLAQPGGTWFAGLTEKQLRRGVHRSTHELEDAIRHYFELNNRHPKPFVWTKTARIR